MYLQCMFVNGQIDVIEVKIENVLTNSCYIIYAHKMTVTKYLNINKSQYLIITNHFLKLN